MPKPTPNIINRTFERLFVFASAPPTYTPSGRMKYMSWVRCQCGKEFTVSNWDLTSGHTKSCGCWRQERMITHGLYKSNGYKIWTEMIQRCTNPNNAGWPFYGGRGIRVCLGLRTFPGFITAAGPRPAGLQIDRWPNNKTGHYSCGKCQECLENGWPFNLRWATRKQQMRNMRRNHIETVQGVTGCLVELCEHFKADTNRVRGRLFCGWPIERALLTPKLH